MAGTHADLVVGTAGQRLPLSRLQTMRILRCATHHARRTTRHRGLNIPDRDDLRQDIVLDILTRLSAFNSTRSPFGAFIELVASHSAQRHGEKADRTRRLAQTTSCGDMQGLSSHDFRAAIWAMDQRLTLERLALAIPEILLILRMILQCSPQPQLQPSSRTTVWRRTRDLRCLLLAAGMDPCP